MGKKIVISEEERKNIENLYLLKEEFRSDDGLVVAGSNKYKLFTDGTERYYDGLTSGGHKVCMSVGWPCQTVSHKELDPQVMKNLEQQMSQGKNPVNYTTPKGKKIEFKKV